MNVMRRSIIFLVCVSCLNVITHAIDIKMIFVRGGSFIMGDNSALSYPDEQPAHQVSLSNFYISETELTIGQWKHVMGPEFLPSNYIDDNLPVDLVRWKDAITFCNNLSKLESLQPVYIIKDDEVFWDRLANGYRLPTEAEWEFAAKGGVLTKHYLYSGSNNIEEVAWYSVNSETQPAKVGSKKPNELNIYDMSGNVWEWCWDWYGDYVQNALIDPIGPTVGVIRMAQGAAPTTGPIRVSRGGSWSYNSDCARVSSRFFAPDYRGNLMGIRLVRSIKN